jgi:hypothetical protein
MVTTGGLFVLSGLLSLIPASGRNAAAVGGLLLLALHASGIVCLELPQRKYQIPRETFTAAPTRAAFRFAFELGTGVRTYITAVSPYALAILIVLRLPSGLGAATFAACCAALGYGLGRSIVVVSQSLRRAIAVDHPKRWLRAADLLTLATAFGVAVAA